MGEGGGALYSVSVNMGKFKMWTGSGIYKHTLCIYNIYKVGLTLLKHFEF